MNDDKYFETNLRRWNELVDINAKAKSYDLEGFKSGKLSLFPIEIEELGNVKGKSLLHLQCHFGMDTLSWARLGANVTGVDFSDKAINYAKCLSSELNIPARFIHANLYDIPNILTEKFDIVFTSYGTICWLPDLVKWAQIISNSLKSGGVFYIIDGHPFGFIVDDKQKPFKVGFNYFSEGKPVYFDEGGAYADLSAELKNQASYQWDHPISDIINAIINANLIIEFLHEFPFTFFSIHPNMKRREDGYWEFENYKFSIPMMFSIRAHKKF
ncbi:MAG: class I SAM-dependent methyltransferase [Promethearchaeota archaeon]